ncbi:helix-turn-helix domain-containing protein [Actinomycetospora endophytica]|uniref:Helix-turn-helix domain-containing protein n=1 Tax=Actinomycetospora endophytica TaxID=2291215 RepID=A0ABS8PCK6_9PSEU|nr:helix-turn-helix domain-containing protein [Actinomycetospora endophytica]MCD2195889.1 helix-turn-helix domain-containing protein [Actinomycetospora endophytica]
MAGSRERPVSEATMRRLELATGGVAGAGVAEMSARLPWFSRLTADQRAGVLMVTQLGAANFVTWLRDPEATPRLTAEAFRSAPPDLARRMTLRQTVELVRIATEVFEDRIPALAGNRTERAALVAAVLRFGREVAFAAATVYASAAESRGAWDARLEALVVDAVVRGDRDSDGALLSRASALGWDPAVRAVALVGDPPTEGDGDGPDPLHGVRRAAYRAGVSVLLGAHGSHLVMIMSLDDGRHGHAGRGPDHPADDDEPDPTDPDGLDDEPPPARVADLTRGESKAALALADAFGPGPVVAGPVVAGLLDAHRSAASALAGHRAVAAWPGAPRPVSADELLPERVLAGDAAAVEALVRDVARPLREAGGSLVETVDSYLEHAGVLEACARSLYVHPNTVRYRLRRVADLTGAHASDARGSRLLHMAIALDRLRTTADGTDSPARR